MKVMTFGTFDILHKGHEYFLKKAKSFGEYLVVVVARDLTVKKAKGRFPDNMEQRRLENLKKLGIADEVIFGKLDIDKHKIIEEHKPDIICLGYDQTIFTENLGKELRARGLLPEIIRLKPYKEHKYKSSKIRNKK
ncbi:FAD synthase [Candidatus Woesearchaeota archaeon]|nr:FAD synthase [Candidatus Woesearchaeota archaeon]